MLPTQLAAKLHSLNLVGMIFSRVRPNPLKRTTFGGALIWGGLSSFSAKSLSTSESTSAPDYNAKSPIASANRYFQVLAIRSLTG